MKEKVGDTIRVASTQEAAGIALSALPKTTKLGLWFFSIWIKARARRTGLQVAPIGRLDNESHRAVIATGAASTLAKQHRRRDRPLRHDLGGIPAGKHSTTLTASTPSSSSPTAATRTPRASLDQLKANLRGASDPCKPIAITTIGIGPDVDPKAPSPISKMTYSDFYSAPTPVDMTTVLARAPFDHECKNGRCV